MEYTEEFNQVNIMFQCLKEFFNQQHPLKDEEWELFASKLTRVEYSKNTIITKEGEIEKYLYFIAKGGVRIYHLNKGKEYSIDFRFENQFTSSYASFLTRTPSRQYMETIENSILYRIPYDFLMELSYTTLPGAILSKINAEQLFIEKELREASLRLDSPDERYINLLQNKKHWLQRVPQHYIASFLHMTPETLSRVKKRTLKKL